MCFSEYKRIQQIVCCKYSPNNSKVTVFCTDASRLCFFFLPTSVVVFKADNIYVVADTRTKDGEGEAVHIITSL